MIHNDLLRKAVQTQYTLVRLPLTVLDERVVTRYAPRGSMVQQSFSRALGVLDATAQRLLTESPDAPSQPEQQRSSGTGTQPRPAPTRTVTAPDAPSEGEPLPAEEQEEIAEVAEELLDEQEEQTFVGELADDDELRRIQAELQAKHLVEEAEEQGGTQS